MPLFIPATPPVAGGGHDGANRAGADDISPFRDFREALPDLNQVPYKEDVIRKEGKFSGSAYPNATE